MTERILVVEDEPAIADSIRYALTGAGFEVDAVDDGTEAVAVARRRSYDLMVLDLLLPGLDGVAVCRTLRAESDLPIVMLTALDTEGDRVLGLDSGADDYVTKPFAMAELTSRIRALLRRRTLDRRSRAVMQRVGGLELDVTRHTAAVDGHPLHLTRSEFRLVSLLASEPGRVFSRSELVRRLRDNDQVRDQRAIDVHISNIRRKLEPDPRNPRRLLTVRGAGYRLVAG